MRTWKRISVLVAIPILFLAGDRFLGWVFQRLALHSQIAYSQLYRGGQCNDVLILGDSRGSCTCPTPLLQRSLRSKCLNLSHNYLGIGVSESLFRDYLDRNSRPQMLVMEVSNLTTNTWGALDNLKPYWRYSPRLSQAARERYPSEVAGSSFSHLYSFNSEMFLRILYHLQRADQASINSGIASASFVSYVHSLPSTRLGPLPAERLATLHRILGEAERRGIEVRLFVSPILPAYREKLVDFDTWLHSLQDAVGPAHRIWDFSAGLPQREAFADRVHVSELGARLLLGQMVASGFFSTSGERDGNGSD